MPTRSWLLAPLLLAAACGGGTPTAATTTTTTTATAPKPDSAKAAKPALSGQALAAARAIDTAAAAGMKPLVRETYRYVGDSRDPFMPVSQPVDLGPDLADLRLVAILYSPVNPSGRIVTFRDIGNDRRYTFTPRQRVGRISVVSVDSNTVKLREDGLGSAEFQTYTLRRPEDQTP